MKRIGVAAARALALAIWFLLALAAMIVVHELGHTLAARLAGDESAYFRLIEFSRGRLVCIGCNHFQPDALGFWGRLFTVLGGLLATQIAFWLSLAALSRRRLNAYLNIWLAVLLLDAAAQLIQMLPSAVGQRASLSGVDLTAVVWLVSSHSNWPPATIKLVLSTFSAMYILFAAAAWRSRYANQR